MLRFRILVILIFFGYCSNSQDIVSLDSSESVFIENQQLHLQIQDYLIDGEIEEKAHNYVDAFMNYAEAGIIANENKLYHYGTTILIKALRLRIKHNLNLPNSYIKNSNKAYAILCKNLQETVSNEAIYWHQEGIRQCKADKDTLNLLSIYSSYALHFMNKIEIDRSLKVINQALPISKAFKDTMRYAHNLLDFSDLLNKSGLHDDAERICNEGLEIVTKYEEKNLSEKDYHWSPFFLELKGFIAFNKGDYKTSEEFYQKALNQINYYTSKNGDPHLDALYITSVRYSMLANKLKNKDLSDSLFHLCHAILMDPKNQSFNPLFLYNNMLISYKESNDYEKALKISEQYRAYIIKSSEKARIRQNLSLKDLANLNIDNAKKDHQIKQEEEFHNKQKNRIIYLSIGLFFIGLISLLLIVLNQQKTKNNGKLRAKNRLILEQKNEITASIEYAEKIQKAILPTNEILRNVLPESYVFYQPRDIVSGDFYWLQVVGDEVLIACADCTGHGVPGAIVSMVGHNGLNTCISEFEFSEPDEILEFLNSYIESTFNKSEVTVNDGMDIAICSINYQNKTVKYAGANIPLYMVSNNELQVIKPNKQPIGKFDYRQPFDTHTFQLNEETSFYMCSDGYQDQFGGPRGKKFNLKNLKNMIVELPKKSSKQQLETVKNTFFKWKGNEDQVDDVCFVSFKV